LYSIRFLLGIGQAGYHPGIVLYLPWWFPLQQVAEIRVAARR
jgi:hypothetical protein